MFDIREWKQSGKLQNISSLILCAGMVAVAALSFLTPIVTIGGVNVMPLNVLASWEISDTTFIEDLFLSYYLIKGFYYGFGGIGAILVFATLMTMLFAGSGKVAKRTSNIMYVMLTMLLIQTLLCFNYINVASVRSPSTVVTTSKHYYLIAGGILLGVKIIADALLAGEEERDQRQADSGFMAFATFVQSFIALLMVFFPLYIFPGTKHRMHGIDIVMGKEDVLNFLPMTATYKNVLMMFMVAVGASFILSMIFYVISRKIFVHINRIANICSLFSLIIYALMGINYMFCYIEAGGYNIVFNTSMNTYSYSPLGLVALFWLGCGVARIASSKVSVQYKVYASPDALAAEEDEKKQKEGKKGRKGKKSKEVKEPEPPPKSGYDPIPAFSELDKRAPIYDAENEKRMEHRFTGVTLPDLVSHVIEYAKYSRERLSYGPVEVKTFMAGLAASRLSILQGMSGTGKTSLPKIFMESIDGFCEIVAIESSWRDKNELLGYYNEFNKKYTPKTFTQYLYKASLNKEVPIFIVLDEMNLSRIEYYFSDFLSLMEAREENRFIKLFDVQLRPDVDERTDYTALRDGHTIDIPTNVWFIGTANRDESTFEISDKVYDRAQTMNFDKRASKVVITEEKTIPKRFVPYSELRRLFNESKSVAFDAEKYEPIKQVEKLLRPYKISFGNRVLKQIEEFVNAYVACSEIATPADRDKFIHEAVDCIVFSKVVRKLELKQINDIEGLIEDFEAINMPKSVEFLHTLTESV